MAELSDILGRHVRSRRDGERSPGGPGLDRAEVAAVTASARLGRRTMTRESISAFASVTSPSRPRTDDAGRGWPVALGQPGRMKWLARTERSRSVVRTHASEVGDVVPGARPIHRVRPVSPRARGTGSRPLSAAGRQRALSPTPTHPRPPLPPSLDPCRRTAVKCRVPGPGTVDGRAGPDPAAPLQPGEGGCHDTVDGAGRDDRQRSAASSCTNSWRSGCLRDDRT